MPPKVWCPPKGSKKDRKEINVAALWWICSSQILGAKQEELAVSSVEKSPRSSRSPESRMYLLLLNVNAHHLVLLGLLLVFGRPTLYCVLIGGCSLLVGGSKMRVLKALAAAWWKSGEWSNQTTIDRRHTAPGRIESICFGKIGPWWKLQAGPVAHSLNQSASASNNTLLAGFSLLWTTRANDCVVYLTTIGERHRNRNQTRKSDIYWR